MRASIILGVLAALGIAGCAEDRPEKLPEVAVPSEVAPEGSPVEAQAAAPFDAGDVVPDPAPAGGDAGTGTGTPSPPESTTSAGTSTDPGASTGGGTGAGGSVRGGGGAWVYGGARTGGAGVTDTAPRPPGSASAGVSDTAVQKRTPANRKVRIPPVSPDASHEGPS